MSEQQNTPKNSDMPVESRCASLMNRLVDYVDGDMSLSEKQALEDHLDYCPECAAFYASYRHVVDSAKELRAPEKPLEVDVQNRLRKALNQRLGLSIPYIA